MDFSILEPLFKLREEVHENLNDPAALSRPATADLLRRVAQHRERALAAIAKAKPRRTLIDDILRAAAAPLPELGAPPAPDAPGPAVKIKTKRTSRKKPK
jgi:hypothetical protein